MANPTHQLDVAIPGVATTAYPIFVGRGLLASLRELVPLQRYSRVFVVTDANVAPHWLQALIDGCGDIPVSSVVLAPGEATKGLGALAEIWAALGEAGCDRRSLVLDLGGGVVGDMGGFAASTFMRGVDFVQLPTTLLSMVDASVGGKLGVNFAGIKNLVGVFRQPQAVVIDLDTLQTLPPRELCAGLAEVLKHGLIRDKGYFADVCALVLEAQGELAGLDWAETVLRSCAIKAEVVAADEREGGVRKILNFGHTAGHAIESLLLDGATPLLHGEAVGLGMLVEAELSRRLGHIELRDVDAIAVALAACGLPTALPQPLSVEAMMGKMRGDKKNVAGEIRWSLLGAMGEGIFDVIVKEEDILSGLARIAPVEEDDAHG